MIAYFDTDAFDHIYRKVGCTSADIANLRKAIYGRQLSIRLSLHTLEEILLGRRASPQAFAAQIKLTLSLASSRTLVKACGPLVVDDIRAYAVKGEAERPFLPGEMQNAVADGISTLIESDGEEMEEDFLAVLEQAKREKQQFFAMLKHTGQTAETIPTPPGGWVNFDQYFDATALPMLDALAKYAGVSDGCRGRGLDGLREIKSVQMTARAALAVRGDERRGATSTSAALHHTVSAAAVAQVYVTNNATDHEPLARLPFRGLNISSLSEFLKEI